MTNERGNWRAILLTALVLAFFQFDRTLLFLLPGWGGLVDLLRSIEPFLVHTLLAIVDTLFAFLCVELALRSPKREGRHPGALGWLGLDTSRLGAAVRLAAASLTPAYLLFALTQPADPGVASYAVVYLAFIGPFAEEVVFRAVGFGALRRLVGFPFWLAAGLPAILFGLGHANPFTLSPSFGEIMTFAITASGAVILSWLYERWNFNLWVPFLLHAFLNLAWSLFRVGDGAFAGWLPLAAQITSLTLAILLTLRWTRGKAS